MVSELLGQLAELGRIIKKVKDDSIRSSVRSKAPRLYAKLERAHLKSFIDASDYLFWRRELWDAEKHYNCKSRTRSSQTRLTPTSAYVAGCR